jgi:hypothetical protein
MPSVISMKNPLPNRYDTRHISGILLNHLGDEEPALASCVNAGV